MFYTSKTKECPLDADEKPKTTLGEKVRRWENSCKGVCGGIKSGTAGEVRGFRDGSGLTSDEES